MKLRENEKQALQALKKRIQEEFSLLDFRLFGSKARQNSSPESDIDVMIMIEKSNPEIEARLDDIVFDINLEHDTFISTVIFSRWEIEEGPMGESPIYKSIQREGIAF